MDLDRRQFALGLGALLGVSAPIIASPAIEVVQPEPIIDHDIWHKPAKIGDWLQTYATMKFPARGWTNVQPEAKVGLARLEPNASRAHVLHNHGPSYYGEVVAARHEWPIMLHPCSIPSCVCHLMTTRIEVIGLTERSIATDNPLPWPRVSRDCDKCGVADDGRRYFLHFNGSVGQLVCQDCAQRLAL